MRAHPLAIIPLQKDLLLSSDASSNSSSRNSSRSGSPDTGNSTSTRHVPMRALVPRHPDSRQHSGAASGSAEMERTRSDDDNALMRSLISLLPHEQADSQFSVTSPVRPLEGDEGPRNSLWSRARPSFSNGEDGGSSSLGSGSGFGGSSEHRGRSSRQSTAPFSAPGSRGLADSAGLDFLGTTDSVRDLLHLPYTTDSVTVGLHRVGQTLVLDGNLGEVLVPAKQASVPAAPDSAPTTRDSSRYNGGAANGRTPPSSSSSNNASAVVQDNGSQSEKIGSTSKEERWVMVGKGGKPHHGDDDDCEWQEDDKKGPSSHPTYSERGRELHDDETRRRERTKQRRSVGKGWQNVATDASGHHTQKATGEGEWSLHEGSWPAVGCSGSSWNEVVAEDGDTTEASANNNGVLSIVPSRPRGSSFGGTRPPEPAGFWRAFQWELAGMRLMLGSSLQVCGTSDHPQVSVRLHDGDDDLSLCTCLDYYLDNVMENVPELALCMREKGYIQGCRLVHTEDIPYLGSSAAGSSGELKGANDMGVAEAPAPLFDPVVVELNATILLRFLQENCSREGGTYLLHRSEGAAHVQLYDVSALSRQRHRRWKWLLAMLCYRFALRISHHTRQPWCQGRRPAGSRGTPNDAGHMPGPEVVRQLLRRQRQLLENTLELLEELAQLGGGGHETICASVQEHIADTYFGYEGPRSYGQGRVSRDRNDDKNGCERQETGQQDPREGGQAQTSPSRGATSVPGSGTATGGTRSIRAPWRIDSEGGVWTSPHSVAPPIRTNGGSRKKRGKRHGTGASKDGRTPDGGSRIRYGTRSGEDSHRSRDDDGAEIDVDYNERAVGSHQTEDDLDKAQDHLTSGIAILRGVMARQESAAAGRNNESVGDVVIVGESRLPVAVMRRPSPWLAVDNSDEENDDTVLSHDSSGGSQSVRCGGSKSWNGSGRSDTLSFRRTRRTRRGSFDESEDPATAISVVSEQLWGLQQKLVGTYLAVARARLGRGFPAQFPSASPADTEQGSSGSKQGSGKIKKDCRRRGRGCSEVLGADRPDEETRVKLAEAALDSLCAAWEHLTEAVVTLDRRAAGILACKEAETVGASDGDDADSFASAGAEGTRAVSTNAVANGSDGLRRHENAASKSTASASRQHTVDERAERLGPLWVGSLSEALARSGGENGMSNTSRGGGAGKGGTGKAAIAKTAGSLDAFDDGGGAGASVTAEKGGDLNGGLAWDSAARRQMEVQRAELFEFCGDVAHACFSLRIASVAARGVATAPPSSLRPSVERLLPKLEQLLSSARPALVLADLDVCQGIHGHTWRYLISGDGGNGTEAGPADPPSLAETCIHSLAKRGDIPGDSTAWSLCLAAETCYEEALHHLSVGDAGGYVLATTETATGDRNLLTSFDDRRRHTDERKGSRPRKWKADGYVDAAMALAIEARARLRRKVGDASNELGKLMSQCAGALVQAPPPRAQASSAMATQSLTSKTMDASAVSSSPAHPGLACAVLTACAEGRFRRGLAEFKAIDDARNSALLLCNLASVERLKPRALGRLREACLEVGTAKMTEGRDIDRNGGVSCANGKRDGGRSMKSLEGAEAAIELCREAHEVLERREVDPRTWDHTSGELAMAYLCLGVDRRQELLATLPLAEGVAVKERGNEGKCASKVSPFFSAPPSMIQGRSVVEPLEQALQIYTDMQNAPQAAACHYQIGQYYAKIFPAYTRSSSASADGISSALPSVNTAAGTGATSALRSLRAWEVGQRAARHFLAARAYFGPFEHGPTTVILALDLCDLYLALAGVDERVGTRRAPMAGERGLVVTGGRPQISAGGRSSADSGASLTVPIPGETEESKTATGMPGASQVRPAAVVRWRCLEGALRSLLETRSVFADAGIDGAIGAAGFDGDARRSDSDKAGGSASLSPPGVRLRRLLGSVMERLPKVLQALVRASVEVEKTSSNLEVGVQAATGNTNKVTDSAECKPIGVRKSGTIKENIPQPKRSTVFKSMYRRSLVGSAGNDEGEGAQAVLAAMAADYEDISVTGGI